VPHGLRSLSSSLRFRMTTRTMIPASTARPQAGKMNAEPGTLASAEQMPRMTARSRNLPRNSQLPSYRRCYRAACCS
jgi:hypothetical protein